MNRHHVRSNYLRLPKLLCYMLIVFVNTSCAQDTSVVAWPPIAETIRAEFNEKKHVFEEIDLLMDETELASVVQLYGDRILVLRANEKTTEQLEQSNAEPWNILLSSAGIRFVQKTGISTQFFDLTPRTSGAKEFVIYYRRNSPSKLKQCQNDYEGIKCGLCQDKLDDSWSVMYSWEPAVSSQEEVVSLESLDEQLEDVRENGISKCLLDGLKEMGVDETDINAGLF